MNPVPKGLPNNGLARVLGRAYAAPGEVPPVIWRGGAWVTPVAAAGVAVCLMQLLSVLL